MLNNFQDRPATSAAVSVGIVAILLTWIIGTLWKYKWFRIVFIVFVCVVSIKIYQFADTWDSFAPKTTIEKSIPVTVEFTQDLNLIVTNTSDRLWLERVDVACHVAYKNGEHGTTLRSIFPFNNSGTSWLPPGANYVFTASSFYSFFNYNKAIDGKYAKQPYKCIVESAVTRTIMDHTAYNINYTVLSGIRNRITAEVYNPYRDKQITAVEASCFNGKLHLYVELLPSDGSYTPPGRVGEYRNNAAVSIYDQITHCTIMRVRYWDYKPQPLR
jgi:hypothetical protein